ncbi:hypothetical protein [Candidatus Entotheonella palauensis]|nr:hypothetical protein [Candidatus Entotheonella palauensis]
MQIARWLLRWAGFAGMLLLLMTQLAAAQAKPSESDPRCPNPVCEGKREFTVFPSVALPETHCGAFENAVSTPNEQGDWACPATLPGGEICQYRFQRGLWILQVTQKPEEKSEEKAEASACPKTPPDICGPGEMAVPKDRVEKLHREVYDILRRRPNGELAKDACNCKVLAGSEWCSLGNCVEKPDTYGLNGVSEVRARPDKKAKKCVVAITYDVSFECTGTCVP